MNNDNLLGTAAPQTEDALRKEVAEVRKAQDVVSYTEPQFRNPVEPSRARAFFARLLFWRHS